MPIFTLDPLKNPAGWLCGKYRLPSGAVPVATTSDGETVILLPSGEWKLWTGTDLDALPRREIQQQVMALLVLQLGGKALAAERLGVSPRTIEGLLSAGDRKLLTITLAYQAVMILAS